MTDIKQKYQDYIRFRKQNDDLRIHEQNKMDSIVLTCSIGTIGIAFGFLGIIFNKEITINKEIFQQKIAWENYT